MKTPAPRNRTIQLSDSEHRIVRQQLLMLDSPAQAAQIRNRIVCQDLFSVLEYLPTGCVDLLVIDPPYNLTKTYNASRFVKRTAEEYAEWFHSWLSRLVPVLKPTASVYICGDWRTSGIIQRVAEEFFIVRNRITWEREKGRGAKANWKNSSEDIWFCTVTGEYHFDLDAVKMKRKVIAPYKTVTGEPKDWNRTPEGDFRLTHPSNVWNDLTVPFWSMPENTDHPTQKPEKLLAKIILASSRPGDLVLDPFVGSGTTAVVAKKLGRDFLGIELDEKYACLAVKRLQAAALGSPIQGYADGVFWERNSVNEAAGKESKK